MTIIIINIKSEAYCKRNACAKMATSQAQRVPETEETIGSQRHGCRADWDEGISPLSFRMIASRYVSEEKDVRSNTAYWNPEEWPHRQGCRAVRMIG